MRIVNIVFLSCLLFYYNLLTAQNIALNSLPPIEDISVVMENPGADTIIIGLHGGPTEMLETGDFAEFGTIPNFSVVEIMQYQHLNPSVFTDSDITLEEAIACNDTTVAIVKKVINHYKNLDKTIVLIGVSFGAFILMEYLDDYGMDDLHRTLSILGRLDMPDIIWENFNNGYGAGFLNDGITPIVSPVQAPSSEWAFFKLLAGVGYNRYTDSLANLDLTRLMMAYGEIDEAVGQLTDEEIAFLENANATVLGAPLGHGDEGWADYFPNFVDFIREDFPVGTPFTPQSIISFNIFPTVIENELNIETAKNGKLTLFNSSGKLVFQKDCSSGSQHFILNNLSKGLYIATYQTVDNEWGSKKLFVQ